MITICVHLAGDPVHVESRQVRVGRLLCDYCMIIMRRRYAAVDDSAAGAVETQLTSCSAQLITHSSLHTANTMPHAAPEL